MIAQLSARNRSDYFRITFEMILSFESKNRWRRKKFCSWKGRRQDGTINPFGSNICIGLSSKWARSASLTLRRSFDKAYTLGEGEEGGGVESSPRFQNLNLAASLLFAPSTLDRFPFDDAPPLVIRPGVPVYRETLSLLWDEYIKLKTRRKCLGSVLQLFVGRVSQNSFIFRNR